jgi:ribosomal protein L37E
MGREINSKAVHIGRNIDLGAYRDDRHIRCSRCGFINNLDRDTHLPEGSQAGWGTTYSDEITMDSSSVIFDHTTVHFDGYYIDRETHVGGCRFCGTYLYNK